MFIPGPTTTYDVYNFTSNDTEVSTVSIQHISAIFLQTAAAQGIAGAIAFASLLLTSYHASVIRSINALQHIDFSTDYNSIYSSTILF